MKSSRLRKNLFVVATAVSFAAVASGCDNPASPGGPGVVVRTTLRLSSELPLGALELIRLSSAQVELVDDGYSVTAVDTVVLLAQDAGTAACSVFVPVSPYGGAFDITYALLDSSGVEMFTGEIPEVFLEAGNPNESEATLTYAGPGANATAIEIVQGGQTIFGGDTVSVSAAVRDADGTQLNETPVFWQSLNGDRLFVSSPDTGLIVADSVRGTAAVTATLLTGQADTVFFEVQPPPDQLLLAGGGSLTGTVGTPLADLLVARALGTDGMGVSGLPLVFTVSAGTLTADTVVTDEDGYAEVGLTLDTLSGTQIVTVEAATHGLLQSIEAVAEADVPSAVSVVAGANQGGAPGSSLLSPLIVRVLDEYGNSVAGVTVSWTIPSGRGTLDAGETVSDSVGETSNGFTRGLELGVDTVVASIDGGASATFPLFTVNGSPNALAFVGEPPDAEAGADFRQVVLIYDGNGDVATLDSSTSVSLSLDGGATLHGSANEVAVGGVAVFEALSINQAGDYHLIATAAGLASDSSAVFGVSAAEAEALEFVAQPADVGAGDTLNPDVGVRIVDEFGNVVSRDSATSVSLDAVTDSGQSVAFLTGQASATALAGHATFEEVSFETIVTIRLVAVADGLVPDSTDQFSVTSGGAVALRLMAQPADTLAGATLPSPLEVVLADAWGNVAAHDTATVTVGVLEGDSLVEAGLRGTTSLAASEGRVEFSDLAFDSAATNYRLLFSAACLDSDTSDVFEIIAGEATRLVFDWKPPGATQNVPFAPPVQLSLRDSLGNVADREEDRAVTLTIVEGTGTPGAMLSRSLDTTSAGVVVFEGLSIDTSGSGYSLRAIAGDFTVVSDTFSILADTASQLSFTVQPASVIQGDTITPQVQVTALTEAGFVDPSFEDTVFVTLAVSPTGDSLVGTRAVPAVSGVAVFDDLMVEGTSSGFRLLATSGSLRSDTSDYFDVAPVNTTSIWTGAAENSWSAAESWASGSAPGPDDDIWIPSRPGLQPSLDTNATIRNLVLEDGATLDIGSYTLTIRGDLAAGNTIVGDSGETRLTGSDVSFSGTVSNLAVAGRATLDGDATTTGYMNLEAGGSLQLGGFTLDVQGDLSAVTADSGTGLLLTNSTDQLSVGGVAVFTAQTAAATTEYNFTHGEMCFAGDLTQDAAVSLETFVVTGSEVVFNGSERQSVTFESPGLTSSRLSDVTVTNAAGVEFLSDIYILGQLSVSAGADVVQESPSSIYYTSALPQINGSYTVETTRLLGDFTLTAPLELLGANNGLHIEDGSTLTVNGRSIAISGNLDVVTSAAGAGLVMNNPADFVDVGGDATFTTSSGGLADTEGNFSEGVLRVGGDFVQAQPGGGSRSFVSTGTRVVLDGWQAQSVSMSTPGASGSYFDALEVANYSGGVTFATPVVALGMLVSPLAVIPTIHGNGRTLDVAGFDVDGLTLDNVILTSTEGAIRRFDDVTFQSFSPSATQMTVEHRGTAVSVFRRTSFLTTPTSGYYISAIDTQQDTDTLTINFSESVPDDGSSRTAVSGGAVVNWGVIPWSLVGSGGAFSCGVKQGGQAYCWGNNTSGERGDGTNAAANTPQEVVGGLNLRRFSLGADHACGITIDAEAYCWGNNGSGRLGNGTNENSNEPVAVAGGHLFQQISAGYYSNCGITTQGLAYCWGRNSDGQLGDGSTEDRFEPVPVSGSMLFQSIATGGAHACGITYSGQAYCWGDNWGGQLGDGTTDNSSVPVQVTGGHRFTAITAGDTHTCALSTADVAYCWGSNAQGRLGDGTYTDRNVPTEVAGGHSFFAISAGGNHTCAITAAAVGYCWGDNGYGQIGDGSQTRRLEPTRFSADLRFQEIAAGKTPQTCGSSIDGSAYCWGWNFFGQLGNGTSGPGQDSYIPRQVTEPW